MTRWQLGAFALLVSVAACSQSPDTDTNATPPVQAASPPPQESTAPANAVASDTAVVADDQAPIWPASFGNSGSGVFETVPSDAAWRTAEKSGPCTRLKDRLTDSPDDVAACDAHDRQTPACIDYSGFAKVWFDLRQSDPSTYSFQPNMLNSLNSNPNSRELIHDSPQYVNSLRDLLAYVSSMNEQQWVDSTKFGDSAYHSCMRGVFLKASGSVAAEP